MTGVAPLFAPAFDLADSYVRSGRRRAAIVRTALRTRSWNTALTCERWGIPGTYISRRAAGLWIDRLDLPFEAAVERPWLFGGFAYASALHSSAGARFTPMSDGELGAAIGPLSVVVQSAEDLFTLDEIFVQRVYAWTPTAPAVVIDIGMNVGFAALALASRPDVIAVYGYEPFGPTFQQATRNLALNPSVASKIRAFNVGLAGKPDTRTLEYTPAYRGSVGLYGLSPWLKSATTLTSQTVRLESVVDMFEIVRRLHPDCPIVAKIDCEGAEYDIVQALASAGRLEWLTTVMLEWHRRCPAHDPRVLVRTLIRAGFDVTVTGAFTELTGMVYAVQR